MRTILKIMPLLILAIVISCKKKVKDPPLPHPKISVKLIDAPSGYDAVNVEIITLEANLGSGWVTFPIEAPGVYNLMAFTGGNSLLLLSDTSVAPATMTELRLILGTGNTVVVDGVTYELKTPSGQTAGYKVKMDPQVLAPGGLYRLILDFDAYQSVNETGNGKYLLKPVVRGYLETAVGSIEGVISPVNGAFYVEAVNATDTAGTMINQETGAFLIPTVMPGTYAVTFSANPGFTDVVVQGVAVVAGVSTPMGTVVIP